jgi:hypothetical protein
LRLAALDALADAEPLSRNICLDLTVHVGPRNDRLIGDLDNYITGICDGLMAADPRTHLASSFSRPELAAIHPSRPIGLLDDVEVLEIQARKVVGDTVAPWYEIALEGE